MLVLSRKVGESIAIGDAVVTVCHIAGDKVRIGIQAKRDVPIRRCELPPLTTELLEHVLATGPDDAHEEEAAAATTRRSA